MKKARSHYFDFVSQGESREITDFFSKKNLPFLLGTDEFVHWVKERFGHLRTDVEIPEARLLAIDRIVIKDLVCKHYGIKRKDLMIPKRGTSNIPRDVSTPWGQVESAGESRQRVGGASPLHGKG